MSRYSIDDVHRNTALGLVLTAMVAFAAFPAAVKGQAEEPLFHDSHFHITNYVQEGTDIHDFLEIMGTTVGRSTIFGLPLQQMWSYANTGDFAPYYYLQSDAPLYYDSFTDAHIAMAYKSLAPEQQARIDPMINKYPNRFMFGSDCVAPTSPDNQMGVYKAWEPVLSLLTPEAKELVLKGNYERIFDKARKDVRAWEAENVPKPAPQPKWSPISGTGYSRAGETVHMD